MKLFAFHRRQLLVRMGLCVLLGSVSMSIAEGGTSVTLGGAGWMQYDVVGKSGIDSYYNGKSVMTTGVQLSLSDKISDQLKIAADLGVYTGNALQPSSTNLTGYSLPTTQPYVSEANFTYRFKNEDDSKLWVKGGLFSYSYNPDVKDLGQYLLRGPVYPGYVLSGIQPQGILPFGNRIGLPTATLMGLQFHQQWGGFEQDLILSSETEFYPFFDLSPAYVATFHFHPAFRIGAGVNFYHLIQIDPNLNKNYDQLDSLNDLTFSGTKLMVNAAFDPKVLMASNSALGPEDLKLYGEVALLGLENNKEYRALYGDYFKRMPVMVGFNIPAFNFLDHLSLEVEWYGAPFEDDMSGYLIKNVQNISSQPYGFYMGENYQRDNWKWSLHASTTIQKHLMLTAQVANDHYRPGIYTGYGDSNPPTLIDVLAIPKDWYASTQISYWF